MQPRTIRTKLARAGINAANTMKEMNLLSGGEQTKVKLAILELTPCNFLIMDEPTNHLDDETKEGLKKALQDFPGNLILVSHEQGFFEGWLDKILNVEKLSLIGRKKFQYNNDIVINIPTVRQTLSHNKQSDGARTERTL